MAKEHQFNIDLKKFDLNIIRSYAYNFLKTRADEMETANEYAFLLNCMPVSILSNINEYLINDTVKKTKKKSPDILVRMCSRKNFSTKMAGRLESKEDIEYALNIIEQFLKKHKHKGSLIHPKVKKLAYIYDLDEIEQQIVTALYYHQVLRFDDYIPFSNAKDDLYYLTNISQKELSKYSGKKDNLLYYEIVRDKDLDALNDAVFQFIADDEAKSFLEFLSTKEYSEYEISSYFLSDIVKETALSVMKNIDDAKILLYGASGTGKTSFAKSLAESCGKTPYLLDDNDNLWLAANSLSEDEVLIIDESDNLFNEGIFDFMRDAKKSDINKKLDSIHNRCIFLSNTIKHVDKSVLRRFNYIIEFKELSVSENEQIWRANLYDIDKILNDEEIKEYAQKYPLPIGIVSLALNTALKACKKTKKRKALFEEILKSHNKVRNGKSRKTKPKSNFDTALLNTDIPVETIKSYIDTYSKMKDKNIRCGLLFHGIPGTGKTEFARYLAELSGYEHITLRVSDFLSPYVGETEQNIADIFRRAEENNTVLIFDEADSLLLDRKGARYSWEVTQVNEFLAQLDSYKGIFIATTNFVKNFDMAAMRRFDWKVEFKALEKDKIYKAFNCFFPNINFNDYKNKIYSLKNITAGDIAVLSSKFKFIDKPDAKSIIEQAEIEMKYKENHTQKSVGF